MIKLTLSNGDMCHFNPDHIVSARTVDGKTWLYLNITSVHADAEDHVVEVKENSDKITRMIADL